MKELVQAIQEIRRTLEVTSRELDYESRTMDNDVRPSHMKRTKVKASEAKIPMENHKEEINPKELPEDTNTHGESPSQLVEEDNNDPEFEVTSDDKESNKPVSESAIIINKPIYERNKSNDTKGAGYDSPNDNGFTFILVGLIIFFCCILNTLVCFFLFLRPYICRV
uniref:Uncharacterized protein n=1 Tax=Cacopsylla melanoneura TaxID=428564 RepID=A0A8D8PM70_9HEMI